VKKNLKNKQSVAPVRQPYPLHPSSPCLLLDSSEVDERPSQSTTGTIDSSKKTRGAQSESRPTRLPVKSSLTVELPSRPPLRTIVIEPGTPEDEIPARLGDRTILQPPHVYHDAETLHNPVQTSSKLRKEINRLKKKLNSKLIHSVIIGDSPKKDVAQILKGNIKPDRHGRFKVLASNGDSRVWGMHIKKPSPSKSTPPTAILYPISGKDIVPFTGSQLQAELESYGKDKENNRRSISFAEHIKENVKIQRVNKRKKLSQMDDESVAPSSRSGSLNSISSSKQSSLSSKNQAASSPSPLSDIQIVEKDASQDIGISQEKSKAKQQKIVHEEPLPASESNGSQQGQSSSSQMDQEIPSPSPVLRSSSQMDQEIPSPIPVE